SIPILKTLILIGIKIGPEAYELAFKRGNILIECPEIRASDASKEARNARLEESTSENAFFQVEEGPMYGAEIAS
ncbi:hypothetical protein TNCT_679651, partial [Trichonephila clavata]